MSSRADPVGFHDGELAVQRRAGVTSEAARLAGMLAPARLSGGASRFLADRTFAALAARDEAGRLWISPVAGPAGFLEVRTETTLVVHAAPGVGDPLHGVRASQPIGMIVIDFAARRRLRINGTLTAADPRMLLIDVEQAYGNCPQYIPQHHLTPASADDLRRGPVRRGDSLAQQDEELIRRADTFLIGTAHPTRGADASHRGGPSGFVRVEDGALWWPDYWGNNMFNTLGNLAVDPVAALVFSDLATGETLQLSGRATVEWSASAVPGDDDHTGRRVRFTPERLVAAGWWP